MENIKNNLTVNYLKTQDFSTKFFTGATGGVTLNGLINMNFYVDRVVIPQKTVHEISANVNNVLGDPVSISQKEGITREVHSGLVCDLKTAKSLCDWLKKHIDTLEEAINKSKQLHDKKD